MAASRRCLTLCSALPEDGKVTRVVSRDQLGAEPNGIALSPDDKYLYLSAGTMSPDPKIMRYPVHPDGSVGPGEGIHARSRHR